MKEKEKKPKETRKHGPEEERMNIRCRSCFVVDGYGKKDTTCWHCGAKIFLVDMT